MHLNKKFNIICGHYGSGKTNLALNLARDAAAEGKRVILADLDVVNPYFRSSDYVKELENLGIRMIAPTFANSNVDVPSLLPELYTVFDTEDTVILDVGGDDVGATVLGRFHNRLKEIDYNLFYVINCYRNLTVEPEEAVQIMKEIEITSRCKATAIVNNSHLKQETTAQMILDSVKFAEDTSKLLGVPIVATSVKEDIAKELEGKIENLYPVTVVVKTSWE